MRASETRQLILVLTLTGVALVTASCGGGGGDNLVPVDDFVPTDPTTEFRLFPSDYFTDGFAVTMNYTGTDSDGDQYTASVSSVTQAQATLLGVPAIPILNQVSVFNISIGALVSDISTSYFSPVAADRHYLGYHDLSVRTISATTSAIPETAKIGDFGAIGTYTDNAGDVDAVSWRLDDAGNGHANKVVLDTTTDQSGTLLS